MAVSGGFGDPRVCRWGNERWQHAVDAMGMQAESAHARRRLI